MLKIFVNDTDRSAYLEEGSLTITDQIQNKANTASFGLNPGVTAPSENQDVKIWDTVELVSASGVDIVVTDELRSGHSITDYGKYRAGEYFWLGIGDASEERVQILTVATGVAGQVNITLVSAIVNSHSAVQTCGKLIFGGTLTTVVKSNPHLLATVEYQCQATDYTKIFDKKNINDSWADYDARQIINDFCNTTVNYNRELDDMDYADNAAIQAEWLETGDGTNPTVDTADFIQGTSAGVLPWTNSGGTATFTASPTAADFSDLVGSASGAPTEGNVSFWYKRTVATGITSIAFRVGSASGAYTVVTFTPEADTDWHFKSLPLVAGTETGTPDWTAVDYLAIIVAETGNGSIMVDDIRITAEGSFTLYSVEDTVAFDDARASFKKPTTFIDRLADTLSFYWYIDYEKDIHFFDRETNTAPFSITDTSDNFFNLKVDIDTSQIKNRQVVRGGTNTSSSTYTQVVEGNAAVREWILKNGFKNLTIKLDDNSSTDTTEAGTNTTTINATTHGLSTGDYIVNRTRSNAVRKVTVVDPNQFTVEAVASQTNGDTFSKFATTQTVGVENLVDETTVNYVSNFTEKSIRSSSPTATLDAGDFLLFSYNEVVPIRVQVQDSASIASLKTLIGGDGIFDGTVITDESLDSTQAARDRGQTEIDAYANAIVRIDLRTDYEGLASGQILSITDTNKAIADDYIIQRVRARYNGDFPTFDITCASTLFGLIEYFQILSREIRERMIDDEEIIDQIVSEPDTITITDVNTYVPTEEASESATIAVTPSESATERDTTTDPFEWGATASDNRWSLNQWG